MRILCASYYRWTGRDLLDPALAGAEAVAALDAAPFAVASHGIEPDPVFNYANRTALALFEWPLAQLITLPSRMSAEPMLREKREQLLAEVTAHGYVDGYSGVRIAASGRRFMIRNATVWNLLDEDGRFYGQAARLPEWQPLEE